MYLVRGWTANIRRYYFNILNPVKQGKQEHTGTQLRPVLSYLDYS